MKPGDKAMLVINGRYGLHITQETIRTVTKTGQMQIEGSDQRYRADGTPTGKRDRWSVIPKLQAWDDALWQTYQMQQSQRQMASNLYKLGEALIRASREPVKAAAIWEALPYDVRKLIEKDVSHD